MAKSAGSASAPVTPADGRLRGQDFAATVTSVSWPDQLSFKGNSEEPAPGQRFVAFTLDLSENVTAIVPDGSDPAITAALHWGGTSHPLTLGAINNAILGHGIGVTWGSGSDQFEATVPNTSHEVELTVSQGSFSQSFNLWTLHRTPPAPTVLYRDPARPSLTGTAPSPANVTLSNPTDGASVTDSVSLQNAMLSYFAPPGSGITAPSAGQAVLSVVMDGEYPSPSYGQPGWGHFLQATSPLSASLVSFTPSGMAPVSAILSGAGTTAGKGNNDDGLFDATYSFVVPATVASGTIAVASGSVTGTEYTSFVGHGSTNLQVGASSMPLTFPAVSPVADQKKPPWIGAPLPPTAALASASSASTPAPSHGFPIWLAVLLLAVLGGGVVVVQRLRTRKGQQRAVAGVAGSIQDPLFGAPATADSWVEAFDGATDDPAARGAEASATEAEAANNKGRAARPTIRMLGPPEAEALREESERRVILALACYLVLHKDRPLSANQIKLAMWPTEGTSAEVNQATFHTYLSKLRRGVGAEHLPDASSSGGYQFRDVESDWEIFEQLTSQAASAPRADAIALRTEALDLVRGTPFQGAEGDYYYAWVFSELVHTTMTVAIATCALTLASDHCEDGDYMAAETAARAGLLGAPDDFDLWQVGAQAIDARGDTTALRRWMADAATRLEAADLARIHASLGSHSDSSAP